jgi:quercetin dioxygenase-like cupin family protein
MSAGRSNLAAATTMLGAGLLLAAVALIPAVRGPGTPHPALPAATAHLAAGSRPAGITSRRVSEEALAHVPGKKITVEIVDFPPGAAAPEHHHGGSVTVYVLAGTVRSQLAGGPLLDYHAGESFFEAPGAVHVVAMNPSLTEPAKFMAIHVADDGAQLTTYH